MTKNLKQKYIKSATTITEIFVDGQKVTAVAIEYDKNIDNSKLSESTFSLEGRTITKVYANNAAIKASQGTDGKYIIIELSPEDEDATTIIEVKGGRTLQDRKKARVSVKQLRDIITTDGERIPSDSSVIVNDKEINLLADEFLKLNFKDLKTHTTLKYNLFIPKGYDKDKSYPMVVFISDRGANCELCEMPVIQGLGGVIWATPAEQAKHESFVLIPQYPCQVMFDDYSKTKHFEITVDLINSIVNQYNIDTNRLYATGQSQGVMMPLEMNICYPDMFAAMLLISGFWNPRTISALARDTIWVIEAEGTKSFPCMNACMASLEAAGAKVSRALWDGQQSAEEAAYNVSKVINEGNNIKWTVFKEGTYTPLNENEKLMNSSTFHHVHTWRVVYPIEALRDWLFSQVKTPKQDGPF